MAALLLATAAAGPPLQSTLREEARVERVVWPVLFDERKPDACAPVGPDDVEVTEEGGPPLPVDEVSRERMPTIHALLVDVSGSRIGVRRAVVSAAARYLAHVRPGDRLLVAHFADDLVLDLPLTPVDGNAGALLAPIRDLPFGGRTALWDALFDLLSYVGERPQRTALVLISDGCENASLLRKGSRGDEAPLWRAIGSASRLVLFPVGIGVGGRHCPPADGARVAAPRTLFGRMAESTGGRFFDLAFRSDLESFGAEADRAFEAIARRLDAEGFVVYRPGRSARGGPARRVHVRLTRSARERLGGACRLREASARRRPPPPVPAAGKAEGPLPVTEEGTIDPRRLAAYRPGVTLPLRPGRAVALLARGGGPEPAGRLETRPRSLAGRFLEVARDAGPLLKLRRRNGRVAARTVERGAPRIEVRAFEIVVPPFDTLRASITAPELALLPLLRSAPPPAPNGRSFPALRPALARALFAYPGYQEWALAALRAARRSRELPRIRAALPGLPASRVAALADLRSEAVEPRELPEALAEWLCDLTAGELARRLETLAVRLLLTPPGEASAAGRRDGRAWAGRIESGWARLAHWFGPATEVRSRLLPVPVYDVRRDRVGFCRVFLPVRPAPRGTAEPFEEGWPARPLALQLARRLVTGGGAAVGKAVRVLTVVRHELTPHQQRRLLSEICPPGRGDADAPTACDERPDAITSAGIRFESATGTGARALVGALVPVHATSEEPSGGAGLAPVCWFVAAQGAEGEALARGLEARLPKGAARCPASAALLR